VQGALIGLYEYGIQRMLFRTPIILGISILLYGQCPMHLPLVETTFITYSKRSVFAEINKESRQNLGVREELIMRNYGFINPLSMEQSDPRYIPALRIALVQFEMVERALTQERKTLTGSVSPQWLPRPMVSHVTCRES
jgi:hypothetical protein